MRNWFRNLLVSMCRAAMLRRYGNYWAIREAALTGSGATARILMAIFEAHLKENGSWVGAGARFNGAPCFPHGMRGIFISNEAIVGRNCVIFQQVTIGSNTARDARCPGSPQLGDDIYIGAGAKIIGGIKVGDSCRIGANAVVYEDLPSESLAVPQSTRVIHRPGMDNRYFTQKADGRWVYFQDGQFVTAADD